MSAKVRWTAAGFDQSVTVDMATALDAWASDLDRHELRSIEELGVGDSVLVNMWGTTVEVERVS